MELNYTIERNAQLVVSLLKQYGIKRIIASPGTTNKVLVWSLQKDPFFEIYSSVDERSAAYLACGMAAESGEPVAITCTGATASRNYLSGLTEAYYRKLPILAITSHQGVDKIGNLRAQNIDRRVAPNDVAVLNVDAITIKDARDEAYCTLELNKAFNELTRRGGGPVHINLFTQYSKDFSVEEIKPAKVIRRITIKDELPEIPSGRIAIFVGSHRLFTEEETYYIDKFCATYDAIVICDQTSGFYGKYRVQPGLAYCQRNYLSPNAKVDLLIHLGEVSGDYMLDPLKKSNVWRVSEDGEMRDLWGKLTKVFEMSEFDFFKHYANEEADKHEYLDSSLMEYDSLVEQIPELPFSNIWMAQQMYPKMPSGAILHLGILNSLRAWNFFDCSDCVNAYSNVGGFGIDGGVSALIGASLVHPEKVYYGVFGDLAFFYDINVLGNRHVGNNVRIMLVNNGRGTEFRNYSHDCHVFGDAADPYMAAAGHFGNKSANLIRHYAEDLGYKYLTASNKEEFLANVDEFINGTDNKSVIFEVFTDSEDESNALKTILNYEYDPKYVAKKQIRLQLSKMKKATKKLINKIK